MSMRRFTRKTNAFSKKFWNLERALALHVMYYNFVRVYKPSHVIPAMEIVYGERLGMDGELVLSDMKAIETRNEKYLSLVMVKGC